MDLAPAPSGFAPHASGLFVPQAVARTREVWTRDDWKAVERASKVLNARQVASMMRCGKADCPDTMIRAERLDGGELRLRCGCTDRILTRAVK